MQKMVSRCGICFDFKTESDMFRRCDCSHPFCTACISTYAPFMNCSVLLVSDGGKKNLTSSECPSCHRLLYAQCKVPWRVGMNCKEFKKQKRTESEKDLDAKFFNLTKGKSWQRYPKCFVYVKKRDGCEHIKCRCGRNFCHQIIFYSWVYFV